MLNEINKRRNVIHWSLSISCPYRFDQVLGEQLAERICVCFVKKQLYSLIFFKWKLNIRVLGNTEYDSVRKVYYSEPWKLWAFAGSVGISTRKSPEGQITKKYDDQTLQSSNLFLLGRKAFPIQ